MKLTFNNKEINLKQKSKITAKLRTEFNLLNEKFKISDVTAKMNEAIKNAGVTNKDGKTYVENIGEALEYERLMKIGEDNDTFLHNLNVKIDIIKLITDIDDMKGDFKSAFLSDFDSDFWQEQDITDYDRYIDSFRNRFK